MRARIRGSAITITCQAEVQCWYGLLFRYRQAGTAIQLVPTFRLLRSQDGVAALS